MVTMLVYYRRREELEAMQQLSRNLFACLSEEDLKLYCFSTPELVKEFLAKNPLMDLACIGIVEKEEVALLRQIRSLYTQAEFLLIADATISPMEYLTPAVRAASLLLYPYQVKQQRQVFGEFLKNYIDNRICAEEKDFFVIDNRSGRTAIPLRQIYYIEVRERKIFIRIRNKEYSKYDSLEHILEQLPENFIRCHRSFIINTQHLERIRLSENAVYLEHGMMVPLSRSYKSAVKEYIHGRYSK